MRNRDNKEYVKKLLKQVQGDDINAFEELYDLYKVQLFNFCCSIIKSRAEVEEVIQDTFLEIWRARDQFHEIISFNGYIYRIAKNKSLNKIRKRSGEPRDFEEVQDNYSIFNHTENEILYQEMQEMLDVAIEALPRKRQEIFRLSREEGLSNEEIAARMGISVNTVKSQMTKALAFLKSYLEWVTMLVVIFIY